MMQYLVLYVLAMLTFHQILRYAQRSGIGVMAVSAVNYVVAAVLSLIILAAVAAVVTVSRPWTAAGLGTITGILYFVNLLVILAAYRLVGVGISIAFVALGVTVPVLVSWWLWDEPMTLVRWAAVALLPVAAFLMRPPGGHTRHMNLANDLILAAAVLVPGAVGCLHKAVNVYAVGAGNRHAYQAALFSAAAVCSVAYVLRHRLSCARRTVRLGSVLGTANVAATLFVLLSLSVMRAVVFYPVGASLVIWSSVVVSWLLWGERVTIRQAVGLCVSVCIVVLGRL